MKEQPKMEKAYKLQLVGLELAGETNEDYANDFGYQMQVAVNPLVI